MRLRLGRIVYDLRTGRQLGWVCGGGEHMALVRTADWKQLRVWRCWLRYSDGRA
jgi:hypothetical protein